MHLCGAADEHAHYAPLQALALRKACSLCISVVLPTNMGDFWWTFLGTTSRVRSSALRPTQDTPPAWGERRGGVGGVGW